MNSEECKKLWKFSRIPGIEESMFNKMLEQFYNLGILGLVKENIQNSLDARVLNEIEPVVVKIETGRINTKRIPGFNEIKERILCLSGKTSYTKETIENMKEKMEENEANYISFEDSNTKGLIGAKNGQSNSKEDTWGMYAYNKGVHSEENDVDLESIRGGSHGIGKIASNAASELNMMYFANCDELGNRHLGGTVQLIEHRYREKYYRSTGYFSDLKITDKGETKFYPFENDFDKVFSKDTRGLKIIIPFLRDQFNNEEEIIKSVCDNFFIAIIEKKLEVIVNRNIINSNTIKEYILNENYYIQKTLEMQKEFTPLYFNTYLNIKPIEIKIKDINDEYKFQLYFKYDEKISKGRVAIIRTIGMKIEDRKVRNYATKPFNAVLIPKSSLEDAFLKSLENESHTEISYEHIKNQNLQRNAKRFINNIGKEIAKIIDEEIKKKNPTEGFIDTKDLLYTVEHQFRKDLSNAISTVKINRGKKEKTLVKTTTAIPDKKKPGTTNTGKKIVKKVKGKNSGKGKKNKIMYNIHPDIVERIVLDEKEILRFNFSESKEVKNLKICDVLLSFVDGMGMEYNSQFNISDNYKDVIDKSTGERCNIKKNLIKAVKIKDGTAQIEFKLNEKFNKALKFVYCIEV